MEIKKEIKKLVERFCDIRYLLSIVSGINDSGVDNMCAVWILKIKDCVLCKIWDILHSMYSKSDKRKNDICSFENILKNLPEQDEDLKSIIINHQNDIITIRNSITHIYIEEKTVELNKKRILADVKKMNEIIDDTQKIIQKIYFIVYKSEILTEIRIDTPLVNTIGNTFRSVNESVIKKQN